MELAAIWLLRPTACAVGCILAPLRGYAILTLGTGGKWAPQNKDLSADTWPIKPGTIILLKDEILFSICGAGAGACDRGHDFRTDCHAACDSRAGSRCSRAGRVDTK